MRLLRLFLMVLFLTAGLVPACRAGLITDSGIRQLVGKAVERTKDRQLQQATEGISQDAKESVALAQQAYQLLLQNDIPDAKDKTADALAHISSQAVKSLTARIVPVNVVVQTITGMESPKQARQAKQASLDDLQKGKVQEARALLLPMVDEIDVQYLQLPTALYTKALDKAQNALAQGDRKAALAALADAVAQLTVNVRVIPIPLVKAKALVQLAGTMAQADGAKSIRLLKAANSYLQLCDMMGYTVANDVAVPHAVLKVHGKMYRAGVKRLDGEIIKESRQLLSRIRGRKDANGQAMRVQLARITQTLSRRNTDQP